MEETTRQIQSDRFLRLAQIVPHYLPISKATFWAWVKAGKLPSGVMLGPRTHVWKESDILKIINGGT